MTAHFFLFLLVQWDRYQFHFLIRIDFRSFIRISQTCFFLRILQEVHVKNSDSLSLSLGLIQEIWGGARNLYFLTSISSDSYNQGSWETLYLKIVNKLALVIYCLRKTKNFLTSNCLPTYAYKFELFMLFKAQNKCQCLQDTTTGVSLSPFGVEKDNSWAVLDAVQPILDLYLWCAHGICSTLLRGVIQSPVEYALSDRTPIHSGIL